MVEDGSVVHFVFENADAFVNLQFDLAEQVKLFSLTLEDKSAVGPDVPGHFVLVTLVEHFLVGVLVVVEVSTQA